MKSAKSTIALTAVCAFVFATVSCKEDPKLIEKREQQKTEIVRLKGELALLEEKLKGIPEDMSSQLAEAERQLKEQTDDIAKLEAETADLDARKRQLQKSFDEYRSKYPAQ